MLPNTSARALDRTHTFLTPHDERRRILGANPPDPLLLVMKSLRGRLHHPLSLHPLRSSELHQNA